EGQRNRPGVRLAIPRNYLVVEDALEGSSVHGARERAETAVAQPIQRGQVCIADWNALETGCLLREFACLASRHGAIYGFANSPVGGDQIRHLSFSAYTVWGERHSPFTKSDTSTNAILAFAAGVRRNRHFPAGAAPRSALLSKLRVRLARLWSAPTQS